ncbi:unnamed protein product [Heligmosomoides polygyrus]|uniref:Inhibitor_I29 domain-containing protein n=1 Tax=Heligmosomoides polygyrus TaxID=6339 RepID=A0A183FIC0_HELPZ|nr:unnamed protein product [Heligmosomoides polygyrus]
MAVDSNVKERALEKKVLYHAFLRDKSHDNWQKYHEAKKATKKAVVVAKTKYYNHVYEKIQSRNGEPRLHRLAKNRHRLEDIEMFFDISDENSHLRMNRKEALKRWRHYFYGMSTEEFSHPAAPSADPIHGPIHNVTVEESEAALRKMRPSKATGPDELPGDLWKSKFWCFSEWLAKLLNHVLVENKVPNGWQESTTILIWKETDKPADCSIYRPIFLLPRRCFCA